LFGILTLGLYRFWGKTRLRRYLWAGIGFDGERFEYTGRPRELLFGFLIALAVLVPLGLLFSVLSVALAGNPVLVSALADLEGVIVLVLVQIAIYRARRYRLTRTRWRGIRGGQSGSALEYSMMALWWIFITLVSLGLAYPVQRTRLQRYRMRNTWFGDRPFEFDARARRLFWPWVLAWLFLLPSLGVSYIWYRVREFRYFSRRTYMGALSFDSDLDAGGVIWIIVRYAVVLLGLYAIPMMAVHMGTSGGFDQILQALGGGGETVLGGDASLTIFLDLAVLAVVPGVISWALLKGPLLRAICATLTVYGEEDFAAIRLGVLISPARGEGLADALDVGSL